MPYHVDRRHYHHYPPYQHQGYQQFRERPEYQNPHYTKPFYQKGPYHQKNYQKNYNGGREIVTNHQQNYPPQKMSNYPPPKEIFLDQHLPFGVNREYFPHQELGHHHPSQIMEGSNTHPPVSMPGIENPNTPGKRKLDDVNDQVDLTIPTKKNRGT